MQPEHVAKRVTGAGRLGDRTAGNRASSSEFRKIDCSNEAMRVYHVSETMANDRRSASTKNYV